MATNVVTALFRIVPPARREGLLDTCESHDRHKRHIVEVFPLALLDAVRSAQGYRSGKLAPSEGFSLAVDPLVRARSVRGLYARRRFRYTCPRCQWRMDRDSVVLAEKSADRHALKCPKEAR